MALIRTTYRLFVPTSLRLWIRRHFTGKLRRLLRRELRRRNPPPVEPHLQAILAALLSPGDCYVDVGACVGGLALVAGRILGPAGRLVCFEPAPWNYRKLVRNLARAADLPDRLETHHAAVGDHCGTITLHLTFVDECHTTIRGVNAESGYVSEVEVPLLTLDAALATGGQSPTLVKIDVEGAEPAVLRGALELLSSARPLLIVEIGNPQHDRLSRNPSQVWDLMSDRGYQGWVVEAEAIAPWIPAACHCRQDVLFVPGEVRDSILGRLRAGNLAVREPSGEASTGAQGRGEAQGDSIRDLAAERRAVVAPVDIE